MKDASPTTIYLKDYAPFPFRVKNVHLTFQLDPLKTRVISLVEFEPIAGASQNDLFLHGEDLRLIWAKIDGAAVSPQITKDGLSVQVPSASFVWECEVEIDPQNNTSLEGLYMSNGMYCTQCEAEGFRKITYYPDRPDVMAQFHVRIEGDLPILLSNGNPKAQGENWAEWQDPWPKPAYLFALVAGRLVAHRDTFTTASGNHVALNIWVRPGDEHKCGFGMEALKASMRWDENIYQREYDLDVFNIVAVDDFNMGAMENKGLNIFNSACVLASPTTSTDKDFERVEAIIAHEYFHNWTGNRITCRDWFQLCLKEGLTVFRDAQFTSDLRSAAVKRIEDVIRLRAIQFSEDAGPLAHPVRPDSFIEINNFYTATVYEKGAELIGMLKTLVGDQAYYKALALYFQRHDGDAATIEDWLQVFEDSTGRDLSQFKNWYTQAGTPEVSVTETYAEGEFQLTFSQKTPATPGQIEKDPKVIPIALGLLSPCGQELLPTQILELNQPQQSFTFASSERPIASILREFSAPILLKHTQNDATKAFLLAHDPDPFNKWQAARTLAVESLKELAQHNQAPALEFLDALQAVASDDALDPAFRALVLGLPSQDEIARSLYADGLTPEPQRIFDALETLHQTLAQHLQDIWPQLHAAHQIQEPYAPNAQQSNARALANRALVYLTRIDAGEAAKKQFDTANNMTQQQAALSALLSVEKGAEQAQAFYRQWKEDRLVIDKWFALQVAFAPPKKAAIVAKSLTQHEDFNWKNPNRFRAVFGSLAGNMAGFHHLSGQGYELMVQWLSRLDQINPQTAARMCGAFKTWRQFDKGRQALLKPLLQNMLEMDGLSRDSREMLSRIVHD